MNIKTAFKRIFLTMLLATTALAISSCNSNPTVVDNPTITQESLVLFSGGSATQLLQGLRRQMTLCVGITSQLSAYASDDYRNIFTFLSANVDNIRALTSQDLAIAGVGGVYFRLQQLVATCDFGISNIIPADASLTAPQRQNALAQARFYKGLAILMLAENHAAFPLTERGPAVPARAALDTAIAQFNAASAGLSAPAFVPNPVFTINFITQRLALARAWRRAGNRDSAAFYAQAAINTPGSAGYAFRAQYDAQNLTNEVFPFVYTRTSRDLQVLPRLDYLDPKYTALDSPIPVLKIEEAHLILAEVELSRNNIANAKTNLRNAITAALRADSISGFPANPRIGNPNSAAVTVRADASAPAIPGLVRTRPGPITVYPTSFTSVRDTNAVGSISLGIGVSANLATANTVADLFRILYLMRQEIFFLEGRRMSDLGIRIPLMQRQLDVNPSLSVGDGFTVAVVPSYIPPGTDMDAFTGTTAVTCAVDMNRVLAANRSQVSPFPMP